MIHSNMILLIDDDTEDQEIFIDALKQINPTILCLAFSDGEEVIALLEADIIGVPHIIFLDLNMPKLSGKQCLARLKKIEKLKETPIVIYTTSTDKRDQVDVKNLGANHYLIKPSKFADLKDRLSEIFAMNLQKHRKDQASN